MKNRRWVLFWVLQKRRLRSVTSASESRLEANQTLPFVGVRVTSLSPKRPEVVFGFVFSFSHVHCRELQQTHISFSEHKQTHSSQAHYFVIFCFNVKSSHLCKHKRRAIAREGRRNVQLVINRDASEKHEKTEAAKCEASDVWRMLPFITRWNRFEIFFWNGPALRNVRA